MSDDPDVDDLQRRMTGAVEVLRQEFSGLRAGRASASLLDHVKVDAYGTATPLNQVSTINVPEPRLITVQVWDKGLVKGVEKTIRDSDLGLNPATVGDVVRVPMPALTEERRKDLIKVVRREAETARVAVRNIRREANHSLKEKLKAKSISEDEEHRVQDDVQKRTDRHVAEIDKALAAKEADLMAV